MNGSVFTVYPSTISTGITVQYIRKPLDPKWTYVVVPGTGEPTFDQSAVNYQDFELPSQDEPNLVNRILQYAGMSIREIPLVQFGRTEEQLETQKQG